MTEVLLLQIESRTVPLDVLPNVPEIRVVSDPLTHVRVLWSPVQQRSSIKQENNIGFTVSHQERFLFHSIPIRVFRLLSERKSKMHASDVFAS